VFAVAGLADDTPERFPESLAFVLARHDWQMRILSRKSDHKSKESVSISPGQIGSSGSNGVFKFFSIFLHI
jgi:hypothetical protein